MDLKQHIEKIVSEIVHPIESAVAEALSIAKNDFAVAIAKAEDAAKAEVTALESRVKSLEQALDFLAKDPTPGTPFAPTGENK